MSSIKSSCSIETLMLEDVEVGEGEEIQSILELFQDSRCRITHLALNSLGINENTSLKLLESIRKLKTL